ncbi:thiol:disulfide interchange protein DsbD [Algimonas ampicilliniresistens]|uniref:Thiol:disulfide interchange protein DsbD n=1 Tax=Algimonas ampicilliniresistens TaxID=1298735 RepID=A0ABQ5V9Z7_9PROT|nr:thioredoxin family protein [Algimonas ampicilliniresistens]GLQ23814.1 thiol:disulfide interchange protein DsbD [Algimonas ampicilliniresistens]
MRALFLSLFLWLIATTSAFATTSLSVDTGRVEASLLSSHYTVTPGQTFQIALKTELDENWHTYWRNPGDSGEPVQITWILPDALSADDIVWPLPDTIPTGPIINYGFEGAPLFPVAFTVAENAAIGSILEIEAQVYYLVCYDICIPEDGTLRIVLQVSETADLNDENAAAIVEAIGQAPREIAVRAAMQADGAALSIQFSDLPEGDFSDAYFFPYDKTLLVHSDPQVVSVGPDGIQIDTSASFGWQDGFSGSQSGVLAFDLNGERTGRIVSVAPGPAIAVGAVAGNLPGGSGPSGAPIGLLGAIIGAFIGGLILNLMPCVFPVISLKALSLAKSAHSERAVARREAWAYAFGIFATFAILVVVLLAIKAGGAELGWGFQLQNPIFVGLMALLLFAVGLNLVGVFEIAGGTYQGTGAGLAGRGGLSGSFFTGALAVLVATPCAAPFMATAVGYALLSESAFVTMLVFAALAAGFAAPFILFAYAPGLLSKLPKPGPWMVRLREFLSFPMFAASLLFVWVVGNQAGVDGMGLVLLAMLAFALAVWLLQRKGIWRIVGVATIILAIALPFAARTETATGSADIATDAWSPERVAELRAEGRPVFVDFTADWCVTCKVNERLVLKTDSVKQAFAETNTAFLIADWTNKNDVIARELESYGRAGVPLYLYFPASDNSVRGQVLPQILTVDMLLNTLKGT